MNRLFSAENIAARICETSLARRQRELQELGRAPDLATPKHLRAHEALAAFERQRELRGVETTQDQRDEYAATFDAVREGE
jgi:hypothetical protein